MSIQPRKGFCLIEITRHPAKGQGSDTDKTMDNQKFRFAIYTQGKGLLHVQSPPFPAESLLASYHLPRNWRRRPEHRRIPKAHRSSKDDRHGNMHRYWNGIEGVIFKSNILQFACQLFGIRIYFPLEIMLQSRHTTKSYLIFCVGTSHVISPYFISLEKIEENNAVTIIVVETF